MIQFVWITTIFQLITTGFPYYFPYIFKILRLNFPWKDSGNKKWRVQRIKKKSSTKAQMWKTNISSRRQPLLKDTLEGFFFFSPLPPPAGKPLGSCWDEAVRPRGDYLNSWHVSSLWANKRRDITEHQGLGWSQDQKEFADRTLPRLWSSLLGCWTDQQRGGTWGKKNTFILFS